MPEVYRALVFLLVLHGVAFLVLRRPIIALGMAPADYDRRRNAWLSITTAVFLVPSFWSAMAAVAIVALATRKHERNPVALYAMLLLALPLLHKSVPGIGPIEHFIDFDHSRVLACLLLLPAAAKATADGRWPAFGKLATDKALLGFFGLLFALQALIGTPLGIVRSGVVYPFLDALILYFVASRTLTDPEKMDDFKAAMVLACGVLAFVAAFEFQKHWLVYNPLRDHLGVDVQTGEYLRRTDSVLRAMATGGHSIAYGYAMMVAIALSTGRILQLPMRDRLVLGVVLAVGLLASVSRGPWVGAAAAVLAYIVTGPAGGRNLAMAIGLAGLLMLALSATPQGQALLDYLPFIGSVEPGSVTYRQMVLEVSLNVIMDKPLFGAFDHLNDPRMEVLRQGQGFIDIVNTYVGVALTSGLVGLALFVAAFAIPMLALATLLLKRRETASKEWAVQARTMLAALVGVTVTIGTASSISYISHLYWLVVGSAMAIVLATAPVRSPFGQRRPASAAQPARETA